MEINIKLETKDIEKMLSRIYGFKEDSVKVSINGNGEIIATASDFPAQSLTAPIFYGPGVRGITTTPDCVPLSDTINTTTGMDTPNVVLKNMSQDTAMSPNDGYNAADAVMDRHFGKNYSSSKKMK